MAELQAIDLETYVKETLLAIARGVFEAQKDSDLGGLIGRSPQGKSVETLDIGRDSVGNAMTKVHFDLATSAEDKSGGGGKAGVKVVGVFDINAGLSREAASSLVNPNYILSSACDTKASAAVQ